MNNKQFIVSAWVIAGLVGFYQLPLIENTFLKYGKQVEINQQVPYAQNFQQNIEDAKISLNAFLDGSLNEQVQKKEAITTIVKNSSIPPHIEEVSQHVESSMQINQAKQPDNSNLNAATTKVNSLCQEDCKVLMIGDSVMGDVDFSMARLLKKEQPTWKVIDAHKVSSGLANQTYYDWPKTSAKLISQHKPDYVVVLVGTNDAQGMMINGRGAALGKENWMEEYKQRILKMTTNFEENSVKWYWIQLPVVRDSGFNQRLQFVRQVQQDTVGTNLVETESIFGKTDHSQSVDMKLRAGDGTHLNSSGANLVAAHVWKRIEKDIQ